MSNASEVAVSKPCFSSVPTGSNMRTSPGQMVRHDATHSSFLPAFHSSACLAACASRAFRVGTLPIDRSPSWRALELRKQLLGDGLFGCTLLGVAVRSPKKSPRQSYP